MKQWEGVQSNGLPTPVFNFIKRVVGFTVATITTDNIKASVTALEATADTQAIEPMVKIVNDEFVSLMERVQVPRLIRKFTRNSAVDGAGCIFTYWNPDMETGQKGVKGGIASEVIDNVNVFFGNPQSSDTQSQPYIIISSRQPTRVVKKEAKANGIKEWMNITSDKENTDAVDAQKMVVDDYTTVMLCLWRAEEDIKGFCKAGEICAVKCTQDTLVQEAWCLGINLYPIVWLPWDEVHDCYHGQAMVTGIIPNQIYVNKQWAMYMISNMRGAYGQKIYDATRIKHMDNRVGGAIPVNGPVLNAVATIDPTPISPQVVQSFQLAITTTEQCLGATSVALGDTRPDNTSAIIALQRAASTPHELTKQQLYSCIEDLFRIYLEFIAEYYGTRYVDIDAPQFVSQVVQFAQGVNPDLKQPDEIPVPFDFSKLKDHPMTLKLDVGASTYYSEIASMQTLDNLLRNGNISTKQYLERIPDDYVPQRRALIADIERQEAAMSMPPTTDNMGAPMSGQATDLQAKPQIPLGGGNGSLQRQIVNENDTKGVI